MQGLARVTRRVALPALAAVSLMPAARGAEPTAPRWRIGWLSAGSAPVSGSRGTLELLQVALRERGLVAGETLQIDARFADNNSARLPELARELLALNPQLLVAQLTPAAQALKRLAGELPIVLGGVADPVATGLVQSLARPGGNITGIASLGPELAGKTLELLREVQPRIRRVGALLNNTDSFTPTLVRGLERATASLGLQLEVARVRDATGYAATFDAWRTQRVDALFVQPTLPFRAAIELALAHRLPSASFVRGWPQDGGLLAYAPNLEEVARQTAAMIDNILRRGAKPAEMPVQQIATLDLLLNRQTARAIGLALPGALLARATEVFG